MLQKLKNRKNDQEGFTIIEVLIVLAIAGLILLIVFLAVPALQRTARNTQRKNDAASLLGAVSNYFSNNGGTAPITRQVDAADATSEDFCGANCTAGNKEIAKLGYYDPANVSIGIAAPANFPDITHVAIVTGFNCNSTNTAIGVATPRTAVALFTVEPNVQQCLEQ